LGRGVRTVQRWEAQLGLPVHRPAGKDHSAVLAFSSELDQWLDSRPVRHPLSERQLVPGALPQAPELQALLTQAEAILQKIDALVLRCEQVHRLLSLATEGRSDEPAGRDLRSAPRVRRTELGAA